MADRRSSTWWPLMRLYPVGRLDADATGLLLVTNDGELAERLTHPRHEVPKTYEATIANPPVREPALRALGRGGTRRRADHPGPGAAAGRGGDRADDPRGPQSPGQTDVRGGRTSRGRAAPDALRAAAARGPRAGRPPALTAAEVERLRQAAR